MKKYNFVVAILSAAFGGAIFWFSRDLTPFTEEGVPGEAFWPHLIAWLFVFLGILQVIEAVAFPAIYAGRVVDLHSPAVRVSYAGAIVAFLFGAAMTWFGFVAAAVLFIPAIMLLMGERRPVLVAGTAVGTVAVVWLFFVQVFNITLPTGAFFG